jgi:HlyD family secretion protein
MIIAAIAIVVIVAGFLAFRAFGQSRAEDVIANLQTETLTLGPLEASVGATGRVRPNQSAVLTFETTGTVEDVSIRLGDEVVEGEILTTLKQTSLPSSIIMAEAELVAAEKDLEDVLNSEIARAQAQVEIAQAQDALEAAERSRTNQQEGNRASETTVKNARAELTLAKKGLDGAKANYDKTPGSRTEDAGKASAYKSYAAAQQRYDGALRSYNWYKGSPDEVDQALLDADVVFASARLADAEREWERLRDGPDPRDVLAAQARVAAAKATLEMSHISAPFSGTITAVEVMPGDQVGPGTPGFNLDDLGRLLVDVEISEVDINSIAVGQPVLLDFDAILDKTYTGEVTETSPIGTPVQGVVNFKVTVELLDVDEAVKPGMTAAVNVIVNRIDDVKLVPNRAIRILDGNRVVYILVDGAPQPIPVVLGASSDLYSEIVEGDVEIGDVIVLNPPEDFFNFGSGPPQGMGGGMGGG